ncbi:MAG: O-antigen ligase family protein, partial [Nanoarchaeota archaeon]
IEEGILGPTIGTFNSAYGKFWSTKTRLIMAGYAVDAFREHPWFGAGYENYGFYTGNKRYLGLLDFNITWPEVNNYPLRVLAEQGIVGFIAFLFFIIVFFYSLFSARKKATDPFLKALVEGYIATFVGIAVMLLFTSNIMKPYIWVTLAFAVATIKAVNSSAPNVILDKQENESF